MAKNRIKTLAIDAPATREEASQMIKEIGDLQRERTRMEADMNDDIAKIKEAAEKAARPTNERIGHLAAAVQAFCETMREDLTQGGKRKFADLGSGLVKWRTRPPSVSIRGVDVVIETLKKLGLSRFVRTKEEINKEAILADQDAVDGIKGISISQKEDFVIEPFETKLEEVQ